jgi:DNA-binding transcriptional MerR regulator
MLLAVVAPMPGSCQILDSFSTITFTARYVSCLFRLADRRGTKVLASPDSLCDNGTVQNEFPAPGEARALTLRQLAGESGFSPRHIRHLIQRQVVSPPVGITRAARYTSLHLNELKAVRDLKAAGWSTDQIQARMAASRAGRTTRGVSPILPVVERRYVLGPGLALVFTGDLVGGEADLAALCAEVMKVHASVFARG